MFLNSKNLSTCCAYLREQLSRYSYSLRARWPGNRIMVEGEIFRTHPERPGGPTNFLYHRYKISFPGLKKPGRGVDHQPHLVPRLKKEKSNNFNPSRDLTACSRVNFTFTFYLPFQPLPLITSNNIWRSPQIMKFSTASMELHSIIPLFNLSWDSKYFLQYSVVEHTSIHSIFSFR